MKLRSLPAVADIPTSSMADVAFLIVVFYMVTMTFAVTRGLDIALPEEEDTRLVEPLESIFVEVGPGGALAVDREPVAFERLLAHLAPKLEREPGKPVIVQARPGTAYGPVVDVLDELRQGRARLGLAEEIQIALPTEREVQMYFPY